QGTAATPAGRFHAAGRLPRPAAGGMSPHHRRRRDRRPRHQLRPADDPRSARGPGVRTSDNGRTGHAGANSYRERQPGPRRAGGGPGVYRNERQDATFLLTGARGHEVLAQTCAVDVRQATPRRLIVTRVAGVNASVLPETIAGLPAYRLWVDPSFAWDLWESLV